jgi:hypothetical protein
MNYTPSPGSNELGRNNTKHLRTDHNILSVGDDGWQQIEALYHAALERPIAERAAFIAQSCAGDPDLRREVESCSRMKAVQIAC